MLCLPRKVELGIIRSLDAVLGVVTLEMKEVF